MDEMKQEAAETSGLPEETESCVPEETESVPSEKQEEILIPVEIGSEIRKLSAADAAALAKKGLLFDAVSEDYEKLKALSAEAGKSVGEYISALEANRYAEKERALTEKCGGDAEMARHIMELENGRSVRDNGFSELQKFFPEIKDEKDLPAEVAENAKIKGTLLLDELLRFRLNREKEARNALENDKKTRAASVGGLISRNEKNDPETVEFLKGLWK